MHILSHFISYSSPSSFLGDSSHSSSPGDADSGLVDDDPRSPGVFWICLGILRRSTNTLRPMTNAKTARTTIVAGTRFIPTEVVEPDPVATSPTLLTSSALSLTTLAYAS